MTNLSILEKNTLDGLSETAGILYLKLLDTFQGRRSRANEVHAFLAACRYEEECGETLEHIIKGYPGFDHLAPPALTQLAEFLSERWRHNFMERLA